MNLLRPDFTENIYNNIVQESKSINIFGEKGVGKSRFVEDLLTLMDTSIKVVSIDIRPIRNHYDKFVEQINKQLDLDGVETLSEALSYFATNHNQALLIIDNLEELYKDNADKKYDFDFFEELNAFKNISHISLIVLSIKNYTHFNFYHNGILSTSSLDIQVMEITPLTLENIETELKSHCTIAIEYNKLANMIIGSKEIYNFIEFIIREIEFDKYDENASLFMNFEQFKKQFYKENKIPWYKKLLRWLWNWFKLLSPNEKENIYNKIYNLIIAIFKKSS